LFRGRGTLSPVPPGIYRFGLRQQRGGGKRSWPDGLAKPPGRFCCRSLQTALGLRPRRALSSAEGKSFPVSFPWGVSLGRETGKRRSGWLELITFGMTRDQALLGELGQGRANGGGAHSAQLAQALKGDGLILLGQNLANSLGGRGVRRVESSGGSERMDKVNAESVSITRRGISKAPRRLCATLYQPPIEGRQCSGKFARRITSPRTIIA